MKVYVKLFATLIQNIPYEVRARLGAIRAAEPLALDLPAGSTLADLVALFQLPSDQIKVVFVNGRAQPLDRVIQENDEVGIFPPIGGG